MPGFRDPGREFVQASARIGRRIGEVAEFIASNQPPFVKVETDIWKGESGRRRKGERPKRNAGELAIFDFLTSDDGLKQWVAGADPVMLLFEDGDIRIFNEPPNLHLLSTIGMLRGSA